MKTLSEKLEKDLCYLKWRAQVHHHSSAQVAIQFDSVVNSYRSLVDASDLGRFETLIADFKSRL